MLNPTQVDFTCQGCGEAFSSADALHYHIKSHKLNQEKYYLKYYPRKDLFTQQPLHFKSRESYFANDFINRTNLKKWLESRREINTELVTDYCKDWLLNRKQLKSLIYAPSCVELKTLIAPPTEFYDELFGDYYSLCAELGFKNKYKKLDKRIEDIKCDFEIIVDSREQRAISFAKSRVEGLKYGDYGRSEEDKVRIERKSLSDFLGTIGAGLDRFEREIQRAQVANCHLIILVEEKFSNYFSFPYLPHIRSKCTVDYISHNIRYLIQKYPNIQFLFADGRKEVARLIEKILFYQDKIINIDLQENYEKGLL